MCVHVEARKKEIWREVHVSVMRITSHGCCGFTASWVANGIMAPGYMDKMCSIVCRPPCAWISHPAKLLGPLGSSNVCSG